MSLDFIVFVVWWLRKAMETNFWFMKTEGKKPSGLTSEELVLTYQILMIRLLKRSHLQLKRKRLYWTMSFFKINNITEHVLSAEFTDMHEQNSWHFSTLTTICIRFDWCAQSTFRNHAGYHFFLTLHSEVYGKKFSIHKYFPLILSLC